MFYDCSFDLSLVKDVKQGVILLTPAESRRLIARAVATLPEVQTAFQKGRIAVMSGGTTSFVLDELTGERIAPHNFSMGMSADGLLTTSLEEGRVNGRVFLEGQRQDIPYPEYVKTMGKGDVIVKGANAIDTQGNAGVLLCNENGGAVGSFFGPAMARGIAIIMPVGLEKLVPSVPEAAAGWGQETLDYSMGVRVGLAVLTNVLIVTEVQALAVLAGVRARLVSSGGVAGNEGAAILLLEGAKENLEKAISLVEGIKGEPPIQVPRHQFKTD
jgi:hypothetical protein